MKKYKVLVEFTAGDAVFPVDSETEMDPEQAAPLIADGTLAEVAEAGDSEAKE